MVAALAGLTVMDDGANVAVAATIIQVKLVASMCSSVVTLTMSWTNYSIY